MSITKTSTEWVVARLNYSEPWLHFLTKCVKPFVDSLTQTGIVERYYWERSYKGGANICLYFRCHSDINKTLVIPNLKEHFETFFYLNPSIARTEKDSFSNNTIEILDYKIDPYYWGGSIGVPIAERHFQSSSEVILDLMFHKKNSKWEIDDILGTAIQMHLGFIEAMGLSLESAIRFFEYCILYHSKEHFRLHFFEDFFETQSAPLIEYHAQLWDSLKNREAYKEDIYNQWLEQCFYTVADYERTFRQRVLDVDAKFSALWTLYAHLMQSTNNRLGLHGQDDTLIFYIIMRSLEKLVQENVKK